MFERPCHTRPLGHEDFDLSRVNADPTSQCPVRGCSTSLAEVLYGKQYDREGEPRKRTKLWCPKHGIRLHSGTFVYWNGPGTRDEPRLRNFVAKPELAREIALQPGAKAESHRLGYEMSEDALSWNVLVSLAAAGRLRETVKYLTGRSVSAEPNLYLWGKRIDVEGGQRGTYPPLQEVRQKLEGGISRFGTEPDIMLVVEGEILVCIEAKFGSGNPLAYESKIKTKVGEKPTSRADLLTRYLGASKRERTRSMIRLERMSPRLHSQLFRNIIFASEMADKNWHVVNLVSRTQLGAQDNARYSFADPTKDVQSYLSPDTESYFTYRTWEDLYVEVVRGRRELAGLGEYMRGKSAHYRSAFNLT